MGDAVHIVCRLVRRGLFGRTLVTAVSGLAIGAQTNAQGVSLSPSLTITETITNSSGVQSASHRFDQVTTISPAVSMSSRSGALQGALTYSANGVVHARDSSRNSVYHTLSSTGNLNLFDRLLDGRGGIEVGASASRQDISAFGPRSGDSALSNDNQTQVFSYSLSPYLRGRLFGEVSYQARVQYSATLSGASQVGDAASLGSSIGLSGNFGRVGWGLDVSRSTALPDSGARTTNTRFGLTAAYAPDVDWQFSLRGGAETDNLSNQSTRNTINWGAGIGWTPTPRTSFRFDMDRRFFGRSHSLSVSHRLSRASLVASDSRSLQQGGATGRGLLSLYDLFYAQFASVEPDPAKRDLLVRNFLAANGLDVGAKVLVDGFLTSVATVVRSQNLSVAYLGNRSTLSLGLFRTQSSRVGDNGGIDQSDLANGSVTQQGLSVTMSYRLTSDSSVVVSLSGQRTPGVGLQPGNESRSIVASWGRPIGKRANVSLSVRHTRFDSDTNPYQESTLNGSLSMQF